MPLAKILVVDDEPSMREMLSDLLKSEGYGVLAVANGEKAVARVRDKKPEVVLLDMKMSGMDGIETLTQIRQINKNVSIIIITAYGTMKNVVEAMKLGIYDYVTKPFDIEKLKRLVEGALKVQMLSRKGPFPQQKLEKRYRLEDIIGKNPQMFEVYKRIGKIVDNKATVLITGETGTGKELVARAIHFNGLLKEGPFVVVDCASLPQDLLESELFGHEKGAFTGAIARKLGKFELAHGGTLFLDEIGNLSLVTQAKLLRVLQEKKIERVGGTKPIKIDVRIIAATHRDLEKMVKEGSFREDLYYRLNVVLIPLSPLRGRKDDIPLLVEHFLRQYKSESKGRIKYVPPETMDLLANYNWPGNVRELENIIERAIVMGKENTILPEDLPSEISKASDTSRLYLTTGKTFLKQRVANLERELIIEALEKTDWIQTKAARLLGMSRRAMRYKMQKYGIEKPS
ncbi:sigma-54-dependent Fis family transcriptional regulator [Candidatus Aerophobetes bacterium]|uniref:DNA-binding transcriptional regulator NtrC n=1 Tax=Aerophobetes bacterium TaxID=2030807 RepID=A0A523S1L6_UNCAE|nr:MAG: sigma-54-dependent Fis family transcriptional regulator [Candidatus Aerophobetes bacterium]